MKVYLDNNVVSAIAKDDEPAESDALDRLLKAREEGKVDLVTSELTLQEIKRYQGPRRAPVERTFRLLPKVKVVRWDELVGIHSYGDARTWINTPFIENHPEYGALLKLELAVTDAQHIRSGSPVAPTGRTNAVDRQSGSLLSPTKDQFRS